MMKCFWLLTFASSLLWIASVTAQEQPKSKADQDQARDAAVLEAVLVDLLTRPDSPVESTRDSKKEIQFSAEATNYEIKAADILKIIDEKELKKLTADQLIKANEAAEHVAQRVEKKELFKQFVPKDKRIKVYSKEQFEKSDRGPQVFRAFPPGYSKDQEFVVVRLSFTWSAGFHGAAGIYVLQKQKDDWKVLFRELVHYV